MLKETSNTMGLYFSGRIGALGVPDLGSIPNSPLLLLMSMYYGFVAQLVSSTRLLCIILYKVIERSTVRPRSKPNI